jgi:hypothetical protein
MADPKVQEVEQRLQAATPGPWAWGRTGEKCTGAAVGARCFAEEDAECASPLSGDLTDRPDDFSVSEPVAFLEHQNANADASLIAHAPGDLRYLLDRLAALEAQREDHIAEFESLMEINREAEAEVARLRQDAARLDWLDTYRGNLRQSVTGDWWVLHPEHQYSVGRGRAIRDAIDAARSSASPTEKLDELAAESQRLGLYDPQPGGPT